MSEERGRSEAELSAGGNELTGWSGASRESRDAYLKAVVDYIKWTTTLAGAAVLWVGNALLALDCVARLVGTAGLLLLLGSLVVALSVAFRVLGAWERDWGFWSAYARWRGWDTLKDMLAEDDPLGMAMEAENRRTAEAQRMVDATDEPLFGPETSGALRKWVVFHVGLLVAGLCAYAAAQLLVL